MPRGRVWVCFGLVVGSCSEYLRRSYGVISLVLLDLRDNLRSGRLKVISLQDLSASMESDPSLVISLYGSIRPRVLPRFSRCSLPCLGNPSAYGQRIAGVLCRSPRTAPWCVCGVSIGGRCLAMYLEQPAEPRVDLYNLALKPARGKEVVCTY